MAGSASSSVPLSSGAGVALSISTWMGIAGSVWLAIGLLSAVGLARPAQIAPILLIQIVYKSVWIVAVALPLLATGDPRALPFVVFFALAIALFAWALPFRALFGRGAAAPVGAVGSSAAD